MSKTIEQQVEELVEDVLILEDKLYHAGKVTNKSEGDKMRELAFDDFRSDQILALQERDRIAREEERKLCIEQVRSPICQARLQALTNNNKDHEQFRKSRTPSTQPPSQ